jgi:5-(carboxyamino)imidazole ribonucleotide mutase
MLSMYDLKVAEKLAQKRKQMEESVMESSDQLG